MWCKSFFISFFIHSILILLLFFIPFKNHKVSDYITVDFTTVKIGYGGDKSDNIRASKGGNNARGAGGNEQKNHMEHNRNRILEARHTEKLSGGPIENNEVSVNPFIENTSSVSITKSESGNQSGNFGSGSHGYGDSHKGAVSGGTGKGGTGKGGTGYGYGGLNISDYAYIREIIMKNITYPERARRMGWEGKVILSFVISETGSVNDVRILKSSGYPVLDEAAKEALFKINQFQKKQERLLVQLPVEFRLR